MPANELEDLSAAWGDAHGHDVVVVWEGKETADDRIAREVAELEPPVCVVAALPLPSEGRRERASRRREVPERPVRETAARRIGIDHEQGERPRSARRRRPAERRRGVRARARVAGGDARARMEGRADERENCGEKVHGRNLAVAAECVGVTHGLVPLGLPWWDTVGRKLAVYVGLIVLLRVAGKRQLA